MPAASPVQHVVWGILSAVKPCSLSTFRAQSNKVLRFMANIMSPGWQLSRVTLPVSKTLCKCCRRQVSQNWCNPPHGSLRSVALQGRMKGRSLVITAAANKTEKMCKFQDLLKSLLTALKIVLASFAKAQLLHFAPKFLKANASCARCVAKFWH